MTLLVKQMWDLGWVILCQMSDMRMNPMAPAYARSATVRHTPRLPWNPMSESLNRLIPAVQNAEILWNAAFQRGADTPACLKRKKSATVPAASNRSVNLTALDIVSPRSNSTGLVVAPSAISLLIFT